MEYFWMVLEHKYEMRPRKFNDSLSLSNYWFLWEVVMSDILLWYVYTVFDWMLNVTIIYICLSGLLSIVLLPSICILPLPNWNMFTIIHKEIIFQNNRCHELEGVVMVMIVW